MTNLSWKSHLRPAVIPAEGLVLLSDSGDYLLEGSTFARLAPLLDGSSTDDQIHSRLVEDGVAPMSAWLALGHLRALGLLRETNTRERDTVAPDGALWTSLGAEPDTVAQRLQRTRVGVHDVGGTGADHLCRALDAAGIVLTDRSGPADLQVVVADDFLDERLNAFNRRALQEKTPWMLMRLAGTVPWIGPLFRPEETGCWACLAQRLLLNRQTERLIEEMLGPSAKATLPSSRSSLDLAAQFAALEIVRWIAAGRHDDLSGHLLAVDLKGNTTTRHTLVHRSQCPECGNIGCGRVTGNAVDARPVELKPSRKDRLTGGRGESAQATFSRYEHHISSLSGIVRALIESCDYGYLHVAASQTFPMHRYDFRVLRDNLLGRSGGKGFDPAQARVSALCEALERYSGIWQSEEESVVSAPLRELADRAIEPSTLFGFSALQYVQREAWNAENDEPHAWVPKPLDENMVVDWVPCWSLTNLRTKLVPAAYAYYGHPDLRHVFCSSDSNGCAAGGTLTEAIAHGLLELIERDSAAIWWFNKISRPAVDLDAFQLPFIPALRELYQKQGRTFWALDLTTDLGVPVIAAISARSDSPSEDIIYGFGSDFDAATAVTKAVLEMNQSLFSAFKAGASTGYRTDRSAVRRWFQVATRAAEPYLLPDPDAALRSPDDFNWPAHDDWRDDIVECVDRLKRSGLETFVLDQTRPDIQLPVCRVIVPGLCHFWRRLGTRRLYDGPVAMAWRRSPIAETDVNSWFIYF